MEAITGKLESLSPPFNNGWRFGELSGKQKITGEIPNDISIGDVVTCQGTWKSHPKYGKQFAVSAIAIELPRDVRGIRDYLSRHFKHIGPVLARKMIDRFGEDLFAVISDSPEKLAEIPGITPTTATEIHEEYLGIRDDQSADQFFATHGITLLCRNKLVQVYGSKQAAIDAINANPYYLSEDVFGIGFKKADAIALSTGIAKNSKRRINAGLKWVLQEASQGEGHCYVPKNEFVARAAELLESPYHEVAAVVDGQIGDGRLIAVGDANDPRVYHPAIFEAEKIVADKLRELLCTPHEEILHNLSHDIIASMDADQQRALNLALSSKVAVITGGPGTGKCVIGDTLVWTERNKLERIYDIRPLKKYVPAKSCIPYQKGKPVLTRFGIRKASHFYYGGTHETICLRTNEGYSITGTPNHRIICATDNGPDWKRLDEITQEDYVAIYRKKQTLCSTSKLDKFAYFLGLFTGDGCRLHRNGTINGVLISKPDQEIHDFLYSEIPKMGGNVTLNNPKAVREDGACPSYRISGNIIDRMKDYGETFKLSVNKTIPMGILNGNLTEKRSFLAGLFDTDGSAYGPNCIIELGLSNGNLLKTIHVMLLQFGIVSILKRRGATHHWRLFITGEDADIFFKQIGFRITRKQAISKFIPDKTNTNRDIVPKLGKGLLREYIRQTGIHSREWWYKWKRECKGQRYPHRSRLIELINEYRIGSAEENIILSLCDNNIYWAKVNNISHDMNEVFDLTVPEGEEFIANGFINHNTWTVNRIIEALGSDRSIKLAAPTGKAAKRMSEMTGRPAQTIHRLLAYSPITGGFQINRSNPLRCDTLIIDESSMIDIELMSSLMEAVTKQTQLIMIGDVNQLPSVGPGRVLADLIESGAVPTAYLRTLHRQAAESLINVNAQRINAGQKLIIDNETSRDFWFVVEDDAKKIPDIMQLACTAIPEKFGYAVSDIQVLCPQKVGPIGTKELNERLRPVLNPGTEKIKGTPYFVGDRVIQTKNNYKLGQGGIFNGDIGRCLDSDRDYLYVEFEDVKGAVEIAYPLSDIGDLQLAYSLTIHKSQGSEFPVVVMPVHSSNFIMLKRNLLYTGITRGKKIVVLVGTLKAVNIAIRTLDASTRYTGLREGIRG